MILWYCYVVWGVGAITLRWWLPLLEFQPGKLLPYKALGFIAALPLVVAFVVIHVLWAILFTILLYKSKYNWIKVEEESPKEPTLDWSSGEYP